MPDVTVTPDDGQLSPGAARKHGREMQILAPQIAQTYIREHSQADRWVWREEISNQAVCKVTVFMAWLVATA